MDGSGAGAAEYPGSGKGLTLVATEYLAIFRASGYASMRVPRSPAVLTGRHKWYIIATGRGTHAVKFSSLSDPLKLTSGESMPHFQTRCRSRRGCPHEGSACVLAWMGSACGILLTLYRRIYRNIDPRVGISKNHVSDAYQICACLHERLVDTVDGASEVSITRLTGSIGKTFLTSKGRKYRRQHSTIRGGWSALV